MKKTKPLNSIAIQSIILLAVALISFLVGTLKQDLASVITVYLLPHISKELALRMLQITSWIALILLACLIALFFYYQNKIKKLNSELTELKMLPKLIPVKGVFFNPEMRCFICPRSDAGIMNITLRNATFGGGQGSLRCTQCGFAHYFHDDKGRELNPVEMRDNLIKNPHFYD